MQTIASRNAALLQEIMLISVVLLHFSHIAEALRRRIYEKLSLQFNISVEKDETGPFQWLHHTHAIASPCYMVFLLSSFVTVSMCLLPFFHYPKMRPILLTTSLSLYFDLAFARANSSGQSICVHETWSFTRIEIPNRPLSSSNRRT